MALSGSTIWEVRTGGSDTNGGGFVAGASGTDWSQQDSPQYSVTDGVTAGSTTITSATANFGTDVVGNIIYVAGGTGSVTGAWYQIVSRTNSTTIVVDRSAGLTAGTGVTLKIGGALATPGLAGALMAVSGMGCYIKAGTYTLSTATPGSGGPVGLPNSVAFLYLEGYELTRGDRTGTRPILSWGAVSAPGAQTFLFSGFINQNHVFSNLTADGNNVANVSGFTFPSPGRVVECVAQNCSQSGQCGYKSNGSAHRCSAVNCAIGFDTVLSILACTATGGSKGFYFYTTIADCIAYSCSVGFDPSPTAFMRHCTADSCSTGFNTSNRITYDSCLATNCSTAGFVVSTTTIALNCAGYNNLVHYSGTTPLSRGFVTLTADPYVSQSTADYRPNNTAGGGASLRGGAFPIFGQSATSDIGAVQHSDPPSSGLLLPIGMLGGFPS